MKKIIFTIVAISFMVGCELYVEPEYVYEWEIPEEVNTVEDVNRIMDPMYYTWDEGGDFWNYPDETYNNGTGDCEDMAILYAYLYNTLGYEVELIGLQSTYDSNAYHMVFRVNGVLYQSVGDYKGERVELQDPANGVSNNPSENYIDEEDFLIEEESEEEEITRIAYTIIETWTYNEMIQEINRRR